MNIFISDIHKKAWVSRGLRAIFSFCFAVIFFTALSAKSFPGPIIPDSADLRKTLVESWFTNDIDALLLQHSEFLESKKHGRFLVRIADDGMQTAIIISPCVIQKADMYTNESVSEVLYETWPIDVPGSWILYRDSRTGKPLCIRQYFQKNKDVFIQFYKNDDRILADIVAFNQRIVKNVSLPFPFESLYTMSFDELYTLSLGLLPWHYVEIPFKMYEDSMQMVGVIRDKLPLFVPLEDIAYNEKNKAVFRYSGEIFNSPDKKSLTVDQLGFVKWIADGVIEPLTGSATMIAPLYSSTRSIVPGSFASVVNAKVNLLESLDWTRNLAVAAESAQLSKSISFNNSGVAVTSLEIADCSYVKRSGYPVKDIKALLYVFAIIEPDRFLFGAISEKIPMDKEVHAYSNAVALFPYFTSEGVFKISVFERGKEFTIEEFIENYKDSYIELSRLKAVKDFYPHG